ncbi:MAG: hypothetical protein KDD43_15990 [Bdellovibrionales bacterium]|nr:hypothetical protein [Bdellovibrionales bacterium]
MKKLILSAIALAFSASALASVETTILTCVQKDGRPGAPSYSVTHVPGQPGVPNSELWMIKKSPINPTVQPEVVTVSPDTYLNYGTSMIFTVDNGRSGYAHFYADFETGKALIDINLFLKMTTNGPIDDYTCVSGFQQ